MILLMITAVYIIIGMSLMLPRTWYASSYAMLIGLIGKFNEFLLSILTINISSLFLYYRHFDGDIFLRVGENI